MDLFQILEIDFSFKNEKGSLVQLVHEGFCQVNVLYSIKGSRRGNHYHKVSREAFFIVSGSAEVTIRRGGAKKKKLFKEGDFFLICPDTWHLMDFPEDCIMVALYDVPVEQEDGTKDIYGDGE